jgi:hypothetical protein
MRVILFLMQPRILFEATRDRINAARVGEVSPVRVVILYQDADAGRRAIEVFRQLDAALSNEFRFTQTMWKFDLLRVATLAEIAASETAAADLIFVAPALDRQLPIEFKKWLETALASAKKGPGALVALFESSQDLGSREDSQTQKYLERVARDRKMDFFIKEGFSEPAQSSWREVSFGSSTAIPRWGINE